MLPNWIYYFIGKKSVKSEGGSGDSKFVIPDNLLRFTGSNNLDFQNCIEQMDFSDVRNYTSMFQQLGENISSLDFSEFSIVASTFYQTFYYSSNLREIIFPLTIDTSRATSFQGCFQNCNKLVNIVNLDKLNLSSATTVHYFVKNCNNLNDETLQRLLKALASATSITSTKTLNDVGLLSSQANKCTLMAEWQTLVSLGWTTGY